MLRSVRESFQALVWTVALPDGRTLGPRHRDSIQPQAFEQGCSQRRNTVQTSYYGPSCATRLKQASVQRSRALGKRRQKPCYVAESTWESPAVSVGSLTRPLAT
jgi:hypothetical protein